MKICFKNNKGFTLIELLVVISIISLLSSIVFASLNGARAKARDVRRMQDLRQIQLALAMFAEDHGGKYPPSPGGLRGTCPLGNSKGSTGPDGWIPNLAPQYISILPNDPKPFVNGDEKCYLYKSNQGDPSLLADDYLLMAFYTVETYGPTIPDPNINKPPPPVAFQPLQGADKRQDQIMFAVFSPGFSDW